MRSHVLFSSLTICKLKMWDFSYKLNFRVNNENYIDRLNFVLKDARLSFSIFKKKNLAFVIKNRLLMFRRIRTYHPSFFLLSFVIIDTHENVMTIPHLKLIGTIRLRRRASRVSATLFTLTLPPSIARKMKKLSRLTSAVVNRPLVVHRRKSLDREEWTLKVTSVPSIHLFREESYDHRCTWRPFRD